MELEGVGGRRARNRICSRQQVPVRWLIELDKVELRPASEGSSRKSSKLPT